MNQRAGSVRKTTGSFNRTALRRPKGHHLRRARHRSQAASSTASGMNAFHKSLLDFCFSVPFILRSPKKWMVRSRTSREMGVLPGHWWFCRMRAESMSLPGRYASME